MDLTKETLLSVLVDHHITVGDWGEGCSKTLDHLYDELCEGECKLMLGACGISRYVRSVSVRIYNPNRQFVYYEAERKFANGDLLPWNRFFSGKIRQHESSEVALRREVAQRLPLITDRYYILSSRALYEEEESPDYPKLTTRYETHRYDISILDTVTLPEGYESIDSHTKVTSFFRWKPAEGEDAHNPL